MRLEREEEKQRIEEARVRQEQLHQPHKQEKEQRKPMVLPSSWSHFTHSENTSAHQPNAVPNSEVKGNTGLSQTQQAPDQLFEQHRDAHQYVTPPPGSGVVQDRPTSETKPAASKFSALSLPSLKNLQTALDARNRASLPANTSESLNTSTGNHSHVYNVNIQQQNGNTNQNKSDYQIQNEPRTHMQITQIQDNSHKSLNPNPSAQAQPIPASEPSPDHSASEKGQETVAATAAKAPTPKVKRIKLRNGSSVQDSSQPQKSVLDAVAMEKHTTVSSHAAPVVQQQPSAPASNTSSFNLSARQIGNASLFGRQSQANHYATLFETQSEDGSALDLDDVY